MALSLASGVASYAGPRPPAPRIPCWPKANLAGTNSCVNQQIFTDVFHVDPVLQGRRACRDAAAAADRSEGE
jgi:hypothetical protein